MPGLVHIGACEVDLSARALRVDGRPRTVEPRVFALLACLAERQGRVVTKQELLETVWDGRPVSNHALARTVMKARQAIGDTGEPALIRTVPRVGYRLAGPAADGPAPAPAPAPRGPRRIALLPFDNATGDASLDWVRLGLMSLVTQALARDPRLATPALASLLAAVDGARTAGVDIAEAVRAATGAEFVVHGCVQRSQDRYSLAFECEGLGRGQVHADGVGSLGLLAARALEGLLWPAAPASHDAASEFADPLVATAFARALQAMAQQKYGPAANLLRMAHALAPASAPVELELLRALCSLADLDGAQPIADRLLQRAQHGGDSLLAARVHLALGRAHRLRSSIAESAAHAREALRLLGPDGPPEEQALGHQLRAEVASFTDDFDTIEQAMECVRIACERSGDRVRPVSRLLVLGSIADARSQYDRSAELFVQAALGAHAVHAQRYIVVAEGNAACSLVQLGRWSEAASHAEQAYAAAVLLNDRVTVCNAIVTAAYVYMVTGVPAAARRVVQALPAADDLLSMEQQWAMLARAYEAVCAGEHERAVQLLLQARQLLRDGRDTTYEKDVAPWLVHSLMRCGRLDEAEAELDAALAGPQPRLRELRHGQAHLLHARGDAAGALAILLEMWRTATVPLCRAWAALDAAWLHAEAGDGAQAQALLASLPAEIAAQPVAHAVAARAHCAAGERDAALRRHRRYLDMASSARVHPFLAGLGACYADPGTVPPNAPGLPSRL